MWYTFNDLVSRCGTITYLELWLWTRTCAALWAGRCAQTDAGCRWTPWLLGENWGAPRAPWAGASPDCTAAPAQAEAWAGPETQRQVRGVCRGRPRLSGRAQAAGRSAGRAASLGFRGSGDTWQRTGLINNNDPTGLRAVTREMGEVLICFS